jgi:serine/threonine protein phosphatase PrpC
MSTVSTPEALAISLASQCDRGKVREVNQGTVRHTGTLLGDLLIVADGVGSDAGGTRASQIAVDTISSCFERMPLFFPPDIAVAEAITQAKAAIVAAAAQPDHRDSGMEIIVVVALLRRDAGHGLANVQAIIGRMGDSRAYLIHNQKLTLLTRDDSAGRDNSAAQDVLDRIGITPQEKEADPAASPYLGERFNVRVEMSDVRLEVGDTLLLCSDGLWGYVSEQEIERELSDGTRTVEEASRALLDLALDAGGYDNVAIEIARLELTADTAAGPGRAEGLRPEIPTQTRSQSEFPPASDTSQHEGPAPPSAAEVQPVVSWVAPEPIVYGTRLNSVQLNAAASVQGKFLYTPGPGYVLPAGTHTLWATFLAAGQEDNPALAEVSITVSKATPALHWHTPAQMLPGVALGTAQLNASASVPGTFEYSPAVGQVLADGTHTLSVTFVPDDKANYATAQATVPVNVAKTAPNIEWASPDPIPYGTPLGAAQLNASASIPGSFEYSPVAGEVLSAGSHTLSAIFTPSDGTSYSRAEAVVSLAVTRATPAIAWPTPEKIRYSTLLSGSQLNATASVPGTFVYTPGPDTLLSAGEHTPSVVFTPSNLSDYAPAQAAVSLSVIRESPTIHWPMPDPINTATPLGPAQLNASASIPGSFTYSPATGETLGPGTHTLSVSFTPADSVNYTPAEGSVSLTVAEIIPASVTWLDPHSISYGTPLSAEQLNASSSIPGSFIYAPAAGEVLPAGRHTLSVIFTPTDEKKHVKVQANVTLVVEELPNVASLLRATLQTPLDQRMIGHPAAADPASATLTATTNTQDQDGRPAKKMWPIIAPAALGAALARSSKSSASSRGFWKSFIRTGEQEIVGSDDQPAQNLQRETRLYRGAVYAKGDDGQWHLQRK